MTPRGWPPWGTVQMPAPVGAVPVQGVSNPSPRARSTAFCPTAAPSERPASTSLR
jgi:hypothetical protein